MATPTGINNTDTGKIFMDLVKFENVPILYDRDEDVTVEFFLDPSMKASTRDFIGIYQVGWDSFESFLTYVWGIGEPINNYSRRTRKIVFEPDSLKNALSSTIYQFVYVSQHLEVMGASRFFQFVTQGYDDLNLSDVSCHIYNSTLFLPSPHKMVTYAATYPETKKQMKTKIDRSTAPSTPSCSINLPDNLDNVFTVCSNCKQFYDLIEQQKELQQKLQAVTGSNLELSERVAKLEEALETMKISNTTLKNWNDELERQQFQSFVDDICKTTYIDGNGDRTELISPMVKKSTGDEQPSGCQVDDFSSREIFLKAIIGHQELRIRDLSKVTCQTLFIEEPRVINALPSIVEDVVSMVQTEKELLPEECEINNNHVNMEAEKEGEDASNLNE